MNLRGIEQGNSVVLHCPQDQRQFCAGENETVNLIVSFTNQQTGPDNNPPPLGEDEKPPLGGSPEGTTGQGQKDKKGGLPVCK